MAYDKTKFDNIHILLPKEYRADLERMAKENRRKISPFIVDLIAKAIEENKKK